MDFHVVYSKLKKLLCVPSDLAGCYPSRYQKFVGKSR